MRELQTNLLYSKLHSIKKVFACSASHPNLVDSEAVSALSEGDILKKDNVAQAWQLHIHLINVSLTNTLETSKTLEIFGLEYHLRPLIPSLY